MIKNKLMRNFILAFFLLTLNGISCQNKAQNYIHENAEKILPKSVGFVNDFENILNEAEEKTLDSIIKEFKAQTTNEIAIVTIDNINPYTSIGDFTTDLGNYWGVGDVDKNNGLIIVVSKKSRIVWLGSGLGTEKVLTNTILGHIVDEAMIPRFKDGKYFGGILDGVLASIREWK
jgi:uncharacterized protein